MEHRAPPEENALPHKNRLLPFVLEGVGPRELISSATTSPMRGRNVAVVCSASKPSSFSVKDILELPEAKGGRGRALDLSDVTLPAALCYGGLCPEVTYSRWLASEIIPAYAALRE
ncbi:hypothetical protein JTE90_025136 [Oedothorax gibbosus]|uniref:Uncharacterized protein n=1 Tax=Oedothorax gibbosus TaxID=931172 RepID=A0AAV6UIF6_9ARAC|nr:hypothetical protein JTE90_025136 [Oedothorax gibbosus]